VDVELTVGIDWLDTSKREYDVKRERLALAVARQDDQAALAAAGWRAEWGLPSPVSTMHPTIDSKDSQEKGKDEITRRRSLHDGAIEPEDGFGAVTLHKRWLEEQADADPVDFAELDSSADSRAEALERRLMQQMQEHAREQQQAMEARVASLQGTLGVQLNAMQEQQTAIEAKMQEQQTAMQEQQTAMQEQQTAMQEQQMALEGKMDQLLALVAQQHQRPH